jgi:hypothetical protein
MITWKEKNGNTITQVQDYETALYIQTEHRRPESYACEGSN